MSLHGLFCILCVTVGVYPDAILDPGHIDLPSRRISEPLPGSAAVPETIPTARDTLPPRAKPSHDWILSVEAATHVPIDMGIRAGIDTPYRLRLSIAYGWVPSAYSNLLTGIAASASGDALVGAILNHTNYQGRTFRGQVGVRPFRSLGLYLDIGLARLIIEGSLDLATSGVPALEGLSGGYRAHTTVNMWLVELGSQHEFWNAVIVGAAIGVMGTIDARTSIVSENGAPTSPVLGQAAKQTDGALESYGYVPTVTFRLGFDFFSLRPVLVPQ